MALLIASKTSQYRAYANIESSTKRYRYLSDDGDINELVEWLENEVDNGRAVGGDVEIWIPGFGWCVYDD